MTTKTTALDKAIARVLAAARAVDRKGHRYRMVGSPELDRLHAAIVALAKVRAR